MPPQHVVHAVLHAQPLAVRPDCLVGIGQGVRYGPLLVAVIAQDSAQAELERDEVGAGVECHQPTQTAQPSSAIKVSGSIERMEPAVAQLRSISDVVQPRRGEQKVHIHGIDRTRDGMGLVHDPGGVSISCAVFGEQTEKAELGREHKRPTVRTHGVTVGAELERMQNSGRLSVDATLRERSVSRWPVWARYGGPVTVSAIVQLINHDRERFEDRRADGDTVTVAVRGLRLP